jgi:hypothetical protein
VILPVAEGNCIVNFALIELILFWLLSSAGDLCVVLEPCNAIEKPRHIRREGESFYRI